MASIEIIKRMRSHFSLSVIWNGALYKYGLDKRNFELMLLCIFILGIADIFKYRGVKLREVLKAQDYWFQCLAISTAICFILLFGIWGVQYDAASFIYFQF